MRLIPPEQLTGQRRCAVTNRTTDPEGFIDTGTILAGWDPEISISIAAAKEMAGLLGWVSPDEVKDLKAKLQSHGEAVRELEQRLDKLQQLDKLEKELVAS